MLSRIPRPLRAAFCSAAVVLATAVAASAGTVTISTPGNNASVSSPFRVAASATSSRTVTLIQIYRDGSKVYETKGSKLDTNISASSGTRRITVQAYDSGGSKFKTTIYVKVTSTSSSTTTTTSTSTSGKTYSDIDHMSGWQSCSACAGYRGDGSVASYSMTRVSSPSLDGKSARFWLGGSDPYSNALWWKQLGGYDNASNFVFELQYYIKKPSASQALEFDVNQTRKSDSRRYIFGTECNLKNSKVWRVYDTLNRKWVNTSIPCVMPKAYTWHKVVLEFQRSSGKTKFISVTVNGKKHYFNRSFSSRSSGSGSTLNVAFQMDGDKYQTDYDVWVDKIKLRAW